MSHATVEPKMLSFLCVSLFVRQDLERQSLKERLHPVQTS